MKRDKIVSKALKSLGIVYSETADLPLNKKSDVDLIINSRRKLKQQLLDAIEESKEALEQINNELDTLHALNHQIEVEEYKVLNPGRDIF